MIVPKELNRLVVIDNETQEVFVGRVTPQPVQQHYLHLKPFQFQNLGETSEVQVSRALDAVSTHFATRI
jgi:hypothetical protein